MAHAAQRENLRRLLQEARARISPDSLRLPPRRDPRGGQAPGLTQAHMDTLLQWSPGRYRMLERGDIGNPGRQMLERLAQILELTDTEYRELWAYTVGQEPPGPLPRSEVRIPRVWYHLCHDLHTMAYLLAGDWNLITYNGAFGRLFPPHGQAPANMMRWMLLDPGARDTVLMDWDRIWAPSVMSQLRYARQVRPQQQALARIEADVHEDPVAGPLYRSEPRAEVHPDGDIRPLHHPELGPGHVHIGAADLIAASGARFMFAEFHPSGDHEG